MAGQADDWTSEFAVEDAPEASPTTQDERETDSHRLAQRQKQVDFGKNTVGYQRYIQAVPKAARAKKHPRTPDVHQKVSKRAYDGQIRKWRRELHAWDLPGGEPAADASAPKNGQGQRQAAGLPLKIPSAMRPAAPAGAGAGKRPRSFLAALLSPSAAPPEAKHHRAGDAGPAATEADPAAHPSLQLMAKWRDMGAGASGGAATEEAVEVEVSYSEDEDEAVPMQAEPLAEAVAA